MNAPSRPSATGAADPGSEGDLTNTPLEFGELPNSTLAALIFELASQLHIERARRLALEAASVSRGLLTHADIEAAGKTAASRTEADAAADQSIRKLLRILSESSDSRSPLRAEAPPVEKEN
jgi:hypothetical protein